MSNGPVAIGGVGGSGTRVVAQIVEALGYDLGRDVNEAHDNLWFNLLFYRPRFFLEKDECWHDAVTVGLELQRKSMFGERSLSRREVRFVASAARDLNRDRYFTRQWIARRLYHFFRSSYIDTQPTRGWGWKEPINHLLAGDILEHFPNAVYVHVIRHGLDMSYSRNQFQMRRFGGLFGVDFDPSKPVPRQALRYWMRANRRILDEVRAAHPTRLLIVNYDKLCKNPVEEIGRLVQFLGIPLTEVDMSTLATMPHVPTTMGRYIDHAHNVFDADELIAVAALGFDVDPRLTPADRETPAAAGTDSTNN